MTDSELANDRTFLAWFRTAIALFGLGFRDREGRIDRGPGFGWSVRRGPLHQRRRGDVLCGAAVVVVGHVQHTRVWQYLHPEPEQSAPRWSRSMTQAAVVGSLALSALLIVTT